ncbi:phosphodiester glycosidase family protein [Aquirufa sp. HETE-83D]|uniref:Phosphodiester glycosidase family protein n=1 Tax=Aquirufa esocilacus TaxID=3096513 RepID=A0ABW6DEI3_9BACT
MKNTIKFLIFIPFLFLTTVKVAGNDLDTTKVDNAQLLPKKVVKNDSLTTATNKILLSENKDSVKIKSSAIVKKETTEEENVNQENESFSAAFQKIIDKNYKDVIENLTLLEKLKADSSRIATVKIEMQQLDEEIKKDSTSLVSSLQKLASDDKTTQTSGNKNISTIFKKILEYAKNDAGIKTNREDIAKKERFINELEKIKSKEKEEKEKELLAKLISSKDTIKEFQISWNKKPYKLTIKDLRKIKFNQGKKNLDFNSSEDYIVINNDFTPTLLKSGSKKNTMKNEDILYSAAGKISAVNSVNGPSLEDKYITWFDKATNYSLTLNTPQNKSSNIEALIEHFGGKEFILTQSNILPHNSSKNDLSDNKSLNESIRSLEIKLEQIANLEKDIKEKTTDLNQIKKETENLTLKNAQLLDNIFVEIYGEKKPLSVEETSKIVKLASLINSNQTRIGTQKAEFIGFLKTYSSNKPSSINKAIQVLENQLGNFLNSKDQLPLLVSLEFGHSKFRILLVDPTKNDIHLHNNGTGDLAPLGDSWQHFYKEKKIKPYAVVNAGMYELNGAAKGLLIENKIQKHPIDLIDKGSGNFYMQPNGLFYQDTKGQFGILDTKTFNTKFETGKLKKSQESSNLNFATQSGPMLVKNNVINSQFLFNSTNLNIRNGVGISKKWKRPLVVMVISDTKVNFYDFALLFKSILGCDNALYLDGAISKMYVKGEKTRDLSGELGPKLLVTEKK